MNFKILNNLPIFDLMAEFNSLLTDKKIHWYNNCDDQICLNTVPGCEDDFLLGRGSLYYDWDNKTIDNFGNISVPERTKPLTEDNFTVLCSPFKGTLFEEVYTELQNNFKLGRVRIMNLKPKTCLSWHVDDTPRIHYPMKTQEGCFMVIDNEIKFLTQNTWWYTDTLKSHTVFNGSKENRYHLVATILEQ